MVPDIPSFDNALVAALKFLGLSGVIIGLVKFAFAVQSWRDNVKQIVRGARIVQGISEKTVSRLAEMRRVRIAAATFVTAAILLAQALTLALCYFAGNLISIFVHEDYRRSALAQRQVEAIWRGQVQSGDAASFLGLDGLAATYLLVAAIFLIRSYVMAGRWNYRPIFDGIMVAMPGFLILLLVGSLFVLALVAVAFFAVWALISGGSLSDLPFETLRLLPLGLGTAVAATYWGACHMAVSGSRLIVKAWSRQAGHD